MFNEFKFIEIPNKSLNLKMGLNEIIEANAKPILYVRMLELDQYSRNVLRPVNDAATLCIRSRQMVIQILFFYNTHVRGKGK